MMVGSASALTYSIRRSKCFFASFTVVAFIGIAVHLRGFWPVNQLAATPHLCVIPGSRNRACWLQTTQTALSGHVWPQLLLGASQYAVDTEEGCHTTPSTPRCQPLHRFLPP